MATALTALAIKIPPEIEYRLTALDREACIRSEEIHAIVVIDQDTSNRAVEWGRLIQTFIVETEAEKERLTDEAYQLVTGTRKTFNEAIKVAEEDKKYLASQVSAYAEKQRLAQIEADRLARVEHDKQETERKLTAGVVAESAGMSPTAVERIISSPISSLPPTAPATYTKPSGTSGRTQWDMYPSSAEPICGDAEAAFLVLLDAAAKEPKLYRHLLQLNESMCKSEAKKKTLFSVPGYEARGEAKTSFRKL